MSSDLQNFLQIGAVGVILTFIVQYIKDKFGTESDATKLISIGLSVVLGAGYYFLVDTPVWLPITGILGTATTFYALFIKK